MLTDWLIVRRLAAELERALRGQRIREVGRLADGRVGLRVGAHTLAIDAFAATPSLTLDDPAALVPESGWLRALADALVGLRVDRVRGRRGDRLIALDASSRSRFGVASGYRLVAELTPRFGNIVLLHDETIVAAAREFAGDAAGARPIRAGEPYVVPPLPAIRADTTLAVAFAALGGQTGAERERASRALRAEVPLVPRLVADSLVAESLTRLAPENAAPLAQRAVARARALVEATTGEPDPSGPVFAYRDGTRLVQAHVVALAQFAAYNLTREPALLPLLARSLGATTRETANAAFLARRAALRARVEARLTALERERAALEAERKDAAGRERLRTWGDLLYAHLAEVPPGANRFVPPSDASVTIELDPALDAKANAAAIFKRYRKATAKLAHVGARLDELAAQARFAGELLWEIERAEPETLAEVAEATRRLERRKAAAVAPAARRRKPLDIRVAEDARIFVGRSPRENADLTFRIARPDDLWFHARATPGAHVVLQLDSEREPAPDEVTRAAALAAFHSKAGASEKVDVDYTERKHVRRQQNAPPGLVWYTNARTVLVAPAGER